MIRMFDRTRRHRLLLVLLFAASVVIITLDFRAPPGAGPLDGAGRLAMTVVSPLQEGARKIFRPVGNFFAGFTKVGSLKARVAGLEGRNAELLRREQQIADIERENAALRKLVGLKERLKLKAIAAGVIGVGPSNFENSIFIDRGTAEGIRKNMPVLGGEGLVGRVVEASAHSARVTLLIDPSTSVAGRLDRSGETGVLQGNGKGELSFELFDPEADVLIGDRVVTSGYDRSLYPAGIPIGSVASFAPPKQSLSRLVHVESFVDFTTLDYVFVVIGGKS